MKLERRFLQTEIRAVGDGSSPRIVGYAATFNTRSLDLGGFFEEIDPAAFDEALSQNPDIVGLFNHNMDYVLGRTSSGTMQVTVDSTGLQYSIDPPDTQLARDLMTSMKRKDIRGSSFGFYCLEESWYIDPLSDSLVRRVLKASVFDCSVVTDPAYLSSDAAVRSQMPQNDQNLHEKAVEMRSKLQQTSQGDHDALEDLQWHLRAHEFLSLTDL
jgi:HK97 family phage prohead protease